MVHVEVAMIKMQFFKLTKFPRLQSRLAPFVADMMELPTEHRKAAAKELLDKFDIPADDTMDWCVWEHDRDYTMFLLRWQ
jgi:hypothetical protein